MKQILEIDRILRESFAENDFAAFVVLAKGDQRDVIVGGHFGNMVSAVTEQLASVIVSAYDDPAEISDALLNVCTGLIKAAADAREKKFAEGGFTVSLEGPPFTDADLERILGHEEEQ